MLQHHQRNYLVHHSLARFIFKERSQPGVQILDSAGLYFKLNRTPSAPPKRASAQASARPTSQPQALPRPQDSWGPKGTPGIQQGAIFWVRWPRRLHVWHAAVGRWYLGAKVEVSADAVIGKRSEPKTPAQNPKFEGSAPHLNTMYGNRP